MVNDSKVVGLPKDVFVTMLRALPEEVLVEIFWKVMVGCDTSPLSVEEKIDEKCAREEFKRGETISWESIR